MLTAREVLTGKSSDAKNKDEAKSANENFIEWLEARRVTHPFPDKVKETLRQARRFMRFKQDAKFSQMS